MNYGAIGSVIGHEITHGFDDTGRLFDEDGNLKEWWQMETRKAFLEKASCLIKQYASFTVDDINKNVRKLILILSLEFSISNILLCLYKSIVEKRNISAIKLKENNSYI